MEKREQERFDYMIAWRDRCIERLQERICGFEEESRMLHTLLFYALCEKASESEGGREIVVDKDEITRLLDKWQCDSTRCEVGYLVRFTPRVTEDGGKDTK